jgi:hypothetical protein
MKKLGQAIGSGLTFLAVWLGLALFMDDIGTGTLLTGLVTAGLFGLGIYLFGRRQQHPD